MSTIRFLTGITPSGTPHLGNYAGMLRPAIAASRSREVENFYFLADYHALIKCQDPARVQRSTIEIAASWLAAGLDPEHVTFYRQSDIPEIPELCWLLTCVTGKGLLNRAHAYKAAVDKNNASGSEPDDGVTAGLFMYPVLMGADILIFNANKVPVGRDQVQHLEMARDMASSFNHIYGGEYFTLPEAVVEESVATLPGLDGRKMSKSYGNAINISMTAEETAKRIKKSQTDSERMITFDPENRPGVSGLLSTAAICTGRSEVEIAEEIGMGGSGQLKKYVTEAVNEYFAPIRERRQRYENDLDYVKDVLHEGNRRANEIAEQTLAEVQDAMGMVY